MGRLEYRTPASSIMMKPNSIFSRAGGRWWSAFMLAAVLVLTGCSGASRNDAMESDVNGYFCKKCSQKFYTERDVYAEHCPKCQTYDISEVMGLVCKNDGQVTLSPRGMDRALCSKCGKVVNEMKLPQENELKSWGAVKETKETVIGKGKQ